MRICYMSTVHALNDNRVFHKMAKGAASAGHEVFLIIRNGTDEVIDGVHVVGLTVPKSVLKRIAFAPLTALRKAIALKADIYHFHDPELVPAGIVLKLLGKRVICDIHENTKQQILNKEYLGPKAVRRLVSFGMRMVEFISTRVFDAIVAARPDIAEELRSPKAEVILNSAKLSTIDEVAPAPLEKTKPVIVYAGVLSGIRGIRELVRAMELVEEPAELWLIGKWQGEGLEDECRRMGGWERTKYLGYMSVEDVYAHMKKGDIGIVTFLNAPNHLTTIPTKPFEYMACYLPVIMSDFEYWRGIFGSHAVFVDPQDPAAIAREIDALLRDKDRCRTLAASCREWVENHYSWEAEERKLLGIYNRLTAGRLKE